MGLLRPLRSLLGIDPVEQFPVRSLKTAGVTRRRTICCFCSCGCGMNAFVRDGRLLALEGDSDNPINEGNAGNIPIIMAMPNAATTTLFRDTLPFRLKHSKHPFTMLHQVWRYYFNVL